MAGKQSQRKMHRFPMLCAVHYLSSHGAGQGIVVDLSVEGLRVEGNYGVHVNTSLTMLLYLSDGQAPAKIQGAYIQWTTGHHFGVKFPSLPAAVKRRLMAYLGVDPAEEHCLLEDPATATEEPVETAVSSRPTVLIVNDDASLLQRCGGILTEEGFTVLRAPGSSEALHLCQTYRGDIHLLLVDARLPPPRCQVAPEYNPFPRVQGEELVQRMLKITKTLRVILMSDDLDAKRWKTGFHVGPLPVLRTPFSRDTLVATLRKVMSDPPLICTEPDPTDRERKDRKGQFVG